MGGSGGGAWRGSCAPGWRREQAFGGGGGARRSGAGKEAWPGARGGAGRAAQVTAVARVKGQARHGTPNMAAAGAAAEVAARSPGAPAGTAARARRPPPARPARLPPLLVLLAAAAGPGAGGAARLYRAGEDAVWVLDSGSVRGATANSSTAWLVQFYSSWCGHCIGYAPTWRALAGDVRGEARPCAGPRPSPAGPGPAAPGTRPSGSASRAPFPLPYRTTPLRPPLAGAPDDPHMNPVRSRESVSSQNDKNPSPPALTPRGGQSSPPNIAQLSRRLVLSPQELRLTPGTLSQLFPAYTPSSVFRFSACRISILIPGPFPFKSFFLILFCFGWLTIWWILQVSPQLRQAHTLRTSP